MVRGGGVRMTDVGGRTALGVSTASFKLPNFFPLDSNKIHVGNSECLETT